MKFFYLAGSIIFTVIILIVGFENAQSQCNFIEIFFNELPTSSSPAILFFGIAGIGIITGGFYFGFINAIMKENREDEDDDSADW